MTRPNDKALLTEEPTNVSRRRFLLASTGCTAGAFVLGFGIPTAAVSAQTAASVAIPGTNVPAFLEIRPDNSIRFLSPFMEGGQGIFTAMAQIVGEELDADPAVFIVESAPAGAQYKVMDNGMRLTGGSMSVRRSYPTMRRLGALARQMLLETAAGRFGVPVLELTTEPGRVMHAASGRSITYGSLATQAMDQVVPDPATVKLKDPAQFRWIGKPVKRVDVYEKSTGKAVYGIDLRVDGMLQAALQHAPRLGMSVGLIRNEGAVKAMKGVHSVHRLPGAVAVVAERWWNAKRAVEALQVDWHEANGKPILEGTRIMPADFSTVALSERLASAPGSGKDAEKHGDVVSALAEAKTVVTATYHSQYLRHAQLEPPSTIARFNADGSLDVWLPNQAPELFQAEIAKLTGLEQSKIYIHSPLLGGFFGRHFVFKAGNPYPQAIQLAKEVGRPVKVIWSREEEFLRDPLRPMAAVRFKGGLDGSGMPVAIEAISACEGPGEGRRGHNPDVVDASALEGLTEKAYAIPHRRIAQNYVANPVMLGPWRSVGHSMNDFFYECFLDEMAEKGSKDPYELRLQLLKDKPRLRAVLKAVVELSGGWKPRPYTAPDGSKRARGIAMASPFGSEVAAIAEVSIHDGLVVVHDIWQAIDPGSIVNPAIIEAQTQSATALALSQVLLEEAVYEAGVPVARNYDMYPILPPSRMARVHVRIIKSGAKMGGVGESPLPAVPPAVANAVSRLTGQRIRSMPLSRYKFSV